MGKTDFRLRKIELLHIYAEFTNLLDGFELEDIHNIRTLNNLSNSYNLLIKKQSEFAQFLNDLINE